MAQHKPKRKPKEKPALKPLPDEQAALLAAVVARPADDTLRLVYADWLQEHDDEEQAQFIRDSIKATKLKPYSAQQKALNRRLWRLGCDRRDAWLAPLGITKSGAIFTRGIADSVFYEEPEDFFRQVEALFRFLPLRHLGIGIGDGQGFTNKHLQKLARTPELARLPSMELHYHMDCAPEYWRKLWHSPYLGSLTYLRIVGCEYADLEAEGLASSPSLKNLTELEFDDNWIGLDGCRALAESKHLKKLRKLRLLNNDFGTDELEVAEALILLEKRFGKGFDYSHYVDEDDEDGVYDDD